MASALISCRLNLGHQAQDRDGRGTVLGGAISELAKLIATPAPNLWPDHRAAMVIGHGEGTCSIQNQCWLALADIE